MFIFDPSKMSTLQVDKKNNKIKSFKNLWKCLSITSWLSALNLPIWITGFNQSSVVRLWDRSEFYGHLRNKKQPKTANWKKRARKTSKALKMIFSLKTSPFSSNCLTTKRLFFLNIWLQKLWKKYIKTTKLRKLLLSTPLNSKAFNGSQ